MLEQLGTNELDGDVAGRGGRRARASTTPMPPAPSGRTIRYVSAIMVPRRRPRSTRIGTSRRDRARSRREAARTTRRRSTLEALRSNSARAAPVPPRVAPDTRSLRRDALVVSPGPRPLKMLRDPSASQTPCHLVREASIHVAGRPRHSAAIQPRRCRARQLMTPTTSRAEGVASTTIWPVRRAHATETDRANRGRTRSCRHRPARDGAPRVARQAPRRA